MGWRDGSVVKKALVALAEDLSSVSSIHIGGLTIFLKLFKKCTQRAWKDGSVIKSPLLLLQKTKVLFSVHTW